jgi:hypothetical protein
MKRAVGFAIALSLCGLTLSQPVHAGSDDDDGPIFRKREYEEKYDIIEDGDRVGTLRRDRDSESGKKIEIVDDDKNVTKVLRRDDEHRRDYIIYERDGDKERPIGKLRREDGDYRIENSRGEKIGRLHERNRHPGEYRIRWENEQDRIDLP